jgi:hypothetical protein
MEPEVACLLAHAEEHAPSVLPAIALAVYAGLRKGEIFGLRWHDLHLDANRLDVCRSYRSVPKSGKARYVPLHPELARILRAWRELCPATREALVVPVLGRRIGQNGDMLGIHELLAGAKCHTPAMPWHSLRHTFASHFMMRGGKLEVLQRLLGHSTLTMTQRYSHLAPDFMAGEVARLAFVIAPVAGVADLAEARRERAAGSTETGVMVGQNGSPVDHSAIAENELRDDPEEKGPTFQYPRAERDTGFEPATFSLGSTAPSIAPDLAEANKGERHRR